MQGVIAAFLSTFRSPPLFCEWYASGVSALRVIGCGGCDSGAEAFRLGWRVSVLTGRVGLVTRLLSRLCAPCGFCAHVPAPLAAVLLLAA